MPTMLQNLKYVTCFENGLNDACWKEPLFSLEILISFLSLSGFLSVPEMVYEITGKSSQGLAPGHICSDCILTMCLALIN